MRKIIFIVCLFPLTALADGPTKFEIQASPSIGWSNYSGLGLGLDSKFRYGLDSHWQAELGLGVYTHKYGSLKDYSIGVNYNFDEDWSRSWFLGAGLGLIDGRYLDSGTSDLYSDTRSYTYMRGGRRFRLNDSGSITWNPYVQLTAAERSQATIEIMPLSFGFSF
jgi:hypothetical protein